MTTETAPVTYDKSAILRAKRLGAWGPGLLTKAEGLWETAVGTFILGERADGAAEVTYRLVTTEEAAELLEAHGHGWRARQIVKAEAGADEEESGEDEQDQADQAGAAPAEDEQPETETSEKA